MKANDIIIMQRPDGRCVPVLVVQVSDGHCVARPFSVGNDIVSASAGNCAPIDAAFEAFNLLPVHKCLLTQTEAEAATLKAEVEQLTAQLAAANEGYISASQLLEEANARLAEKSEAPAPAP